MSKELEDFLESIQTTALQLSTVMYDEDTTKLLHVLQKLGIEISNWLEEKVRIMEQKSSNGN